MNISMYMKKKYECNKPFNKLLLYMILNLMLLVNINI